MFTLKRKQEDKNIDSIPEVKTAFEIKSLEDVKVEGQFKEKHDIAVELGLPKQAMIAKLESLGFQTIRRADFRRLLDIKDDRNLFNWGDIFDPEYAGSIPFNILCKIKQVKDMNVFDRLHIIAPTDEAVEDPLLIGEKYTEHDEIDPERGYQEEYGGRHPNFWRRDTIVMLIAKWE